MCRRGLFKTWSGGKENVPKCPVGAPNQAPLLPQNSSARKAQAIQAYDVTKLDDAWPRLGHILLAHQHRSPGRGGLDIFQFEKFKNPYLDWKGEKFEKEWLAAHPLPEPKAEAA
ncbi:unnamed protein product [Effrenium voratum]|nr:unnamed protein product [Effrenium voratum]